MASMLSSFFHPERSYKEAERAAQEAWLQAQGFQKPFMEHGLEQYDPLNKARANLLNPVELEGQWSDAYKTSPEAMNALRENRTQGLESAGSMGLMGSSAALKNIQQGAGDIVSKDRQQFLNNLMQKYLAGIGLGENLYGTGANAGANLGQQALGHGDTMAGLQFGRYAAPGKLFGQMGGLALNAMNPGMAGRMNNAPNFNPYGA